jgi:hypothetical protein
MSFLPAFMGKKKDALAAGSHAATVAAGTAVPIASKSGAGKAKAVKTSESADTQRKKRRSKRAKTTLISKTIGKRVPDGSFRLIRPTTRHMLQAIVFQQTNGILEELSTMKVKTIKPQHVVLAMYRRMPSSFASHLHTNIQADPEYANMVLKKFKRAAKTA